MHSEIYRLSLKSDRKFDLLVGSIKRITIKLPTSECISTFLALLSKKARSV